jgi:hypothetical protein
VQCQSGLLEAATTTVLDPATSASHGRRLAAGGVRGATGTDTGTASGSALPVALQCTASSSSDRDSESESGAPTASGTGTALVLQSSRHCSCHWHCSLSVRVSRLQVTSNLVVNAQSLAVPLAVSVVLVAECSSFPRHDVIAPTASDSENGKR